VVLVALFVQDWVIEWAVTDGILTTDRKRQRIKPADSGVSIVPTDTVSPSPTRRWST
jgi:hypothetical protein